MNSYWYLLKVIPGKERVLTELFNQQLSLGKFKNIKRFLCPTESEFVTVKKKKVLREKVIYSGYLYFESNDKLSEDEMKEFGNTPNVMTMLGDKQPVLLRENDVKRIIKDELLEEHLGNKKLTSEVGDKVTIIDGVFASFNGVISKINGNKVEVEVKIFGRDTNVMLSLTQIKSNV